MRIMQVGNGEKPFHSILRTFCWIDFHNACRAFDVLFFHCHKQTVVAGNGHCAVDVGTNKDFPINHTFINIITVNPTRAARYVNAVAEQGGGRLGNKVGASCGYILLIIKEYLTVNFGLQHAVFHCGFCWVGVENCEISVFERNVSGVANHKCRGVNITAVTVCGNGV